MLHEIVSLLLASGVVGAIVKYFWDARREKENRISAIALRVLVIREQMETLAVCITDREPLDCYFFRAYELNLRRFEEALDDVFVYGLFKELFDSKNSAFTLHVAFLQALVDTAAFDLPKSSPSPEELKAWCPNHLTQGMIRVIDVCDKHYSRYLSKAIKAAMKDSIPPELRPGAWTYAMSGC